MKKTEERVGSYKQGHICRCGKFATHSQYKVCPKCGKDWGDAGLASAQEVYHFKKDLWEWKFTGITYRNIKWRSKDCSYCGMNTCGCGAEV